LFERHLVHGFLVLAFFADELGDGNGFVAEEGFREVIHVVALVGVDERVGDHGVEEFALDGNALLGEDCDVKFEVVADFEGGRVGKEVFEGVEEGVVGIAGQGDVAGAFGFCAEGDAEQAAVERIEPGGLGVEAEAL